MFFVTSKQERETMAIEILFHQFCLVADDDVLATNRTRNKKL